MKHTREENTIAPVSKESNQVSKQTARVSVEIESK